MSVICPIHHEFIGYPYVRPISQLVAPRRHPLWLVYKLMASLSCSMLSKHLFVGEDDENETDGKFDGRDVVEGTMDDKADGGVDGVIDPGREGGADSTELLDGGVDGTKTTTAVLGDDSTVFELEPVNSTDIVPSTEMTIMATTNIMQMNAKNGLAFSCMYHGGGSWSWSGSGSRTGTPSYTGSFGTSVASRWIMDSSSFSSMDLGGGFIGSITASCCGRPEFTATSFRL
mmetsp:Transcript_22360/g.40310  ORF Transcript_22360/g.40310 Transcript_22360/m.40310 type:complete len:230 (+) Transcript_22360:467-1156(+)